MNPLNQFIVSTIQLLPKRLVRPFAMRYIAGEKVEEAVRLVKSLNKGHWMASMDILGENVFTKDESLKAVKKCEEVLEAIQTHGLDANLSIKLTQFGLKIDPEFCYANVRTLLGVARRFSLFVRIDMEDSSTTNDTLRLYERLRADGFENSGVVIQANLRRSDEDVNRLIGLKANVRLCKGAYIEPETIALKDRQDIRDHYLKLLGMLLDAGCYVGIATHDEFLMEEACRLVGEKKVQKRDYEFQMLYGVKVKLWERIVTDGHRLRIYVPFGESWHAYSMRRFQENPQIVRYILKGIFTKAWIERDTLNR